jgi:hypothetical protein
MFLFYTTTIRFLHPLQHVGIELFPKYFVPSIEDAFLMIIASSTWGVRIDICGFLCLIRRYASSFYNWPYANVACTTINIVAVILATDRLRAEVHIEILALDIIGCVVSDLIGISLIVLLIE